MLQNSHAFGSFSTDDIEKARVFYSEVLGLDVKDNPMGFIDLQLVGGGRTIIYPKPDHQPAVFTVLSFPVDDLDKVVDELIAKGVKMERYDGFNQNEKGIARSDNPEHGPDIAWFKDPAGNILAVLQSNP